MNQTLFVSESNIWHDNLNKNTRVNTLILFPPLLIALKLIFLFLVYKIYATGQIRELNFRVLFTLPGKFALQIENI